jgi:hypothetical protein
MSATRIDYGEEGKRGSYKVLAGKPEGKNLESWKT